MKTSEQSVAVSYVYKVIKSHKNDNNADDENQDTRVDETLNTGNIGEVGTQIHHWTRHQEAAAKRFDDDLQVRHNETVVEKVHQRIISKSIFYL